MKKQQDIFKDFLVIVFVVIYFLTATTHIFFIPCLTQVAQHENTSVKSIFKRQSENVTVGFYHPGLVRLPDKSTVVDTRTASDIIKSGLSFFILLLFIPLVWKLKPKIFAGNFKRLSLPKQSFLSLCIIRI